MKDWGGKGQGLADFDSQVSPPSCTIFSTYKLANIIQSHIQRVGQLFHSGDGTIAFTFLNINDLHAVDIRTGRQVDIETIRDTRAKP